MRAIDADALTEFLKCLLPERGMWEIEGDTVKNAVCETVAEAIEMVKNMETIQPEKAQFSLEGTTKGTTSDTISKTETVERLRRMLEATVPNTDYDEGFIDGVEFGISTVSTMPSAQPVATDTNVGDKISKFIDGLEEIFADLRERHVDDSVCGLCEYDGAYIGQSDEWCNECPGFDRDDCFKLSGETRKEWTEEILKALSSVQPETAKRIVGKSRDGMTLWYQCDMCNEPVDEQDNYCRGCGRRLIDG